MLDGDVAGWHALAMSDDPPDTLYSPFPCAPCAPADPIPLPRPEWAYFLDFDGTLVELAPTPEGVTVTPALRALLDGLTQATNGAVAVVSGRAIADVDKFLAPLRMPAAGLHGVEFRVHGAVEDIASAITTGVEQALDRVRRCLADLAAAEPGIRLEDKGGAIAVHYRAVPAAAERVRETVEAAVDGTPDLHIQHGKKVFEIKPSDTHKGEAVERFLREQPFAGRRPVFVGDDTTDEDGFAAVNAHGGLSVKVGEAGETLAGATLPDVAAVHRWLASMLQPG